MTIELLRNSHLSTGKFLSTQLQNAPVSSQLCWITGDLINFDTWNLKIMKRKGTSSDQTPPLLGVLDVWLLQNLQPDLGTRDDETII